MVVLCIPDVHLKPEILTEAGKLMDRKVAERAVFLGDLPDEWCCELDLEAYAATYSAAISFAKRYPCTFCLGNHDLAYEWHKTDHAGYSCFCESLVRQRMADLADVLETPPLIVCRIGRCLFSHGGVLDAFVRDSVPYELYDDIDAVVDRINAMTGSDLFDNGFSPIWARPQLTGMALYKPDQLLQVVGHTPVREITKDCSLVSCDTFSTDPYLRPIGNREFALIDTENREVRSIPSR